MPPVNATNTGADYHAALKLLRAGRLADARHAFMTLRMALPGKAEIPFQLGRLELADGKPGPACDHLAAAARLKPGEPAILSALKDAQIAACRPDAALASFDALIAADPHPLRHVADKGQFLQQIGHFDAAARTFDAAIAQAPREGELYRLAVATRRLEAADPLIAQMRRLWRDPSIAGLSRAHLGFALAKAMADVVDHGRVFGYLDPANAAMRALHPPDLDARRAQAARLRRTFAAAFDGHDDVPPSGPGDTAPIFVTGMPRSGTTLVEQVLASHSAVTGGGEMGHAMRLMSPLLAAGGMGLARLRAYGAGYEAAARRTLQFDRVFVDKSIQSYQLIGLLRRALPASRVIVVRRDPRDLLFSLYRSVFRKGQHLYAYDQRDLVAQYVMFYDWLAFWRETAPGSFTEVSYEALVADPAGESRALIAAAGLDWEEACLTPHLTDRRVETLSLHQVRQPIHAGAVDGWKRHVRELAPMLEALDVAGLLP